MANKLTKDALVENMLVRLQAFNDEKFELNGDTIHIAVLSDTDGFHGAPSSKKLYYGAIQWIIWANEGKKVKLPTNWIEQSVNEVADFIISKQTA